MKKLEKYDPELPVIVTHIGPNHQYGVKLEDIELVKYPYFGNDYDAMEGFGMKSYEEHEDGDDDDLLFLNIASI